jgi:GNAT superfamily N-acetyltransferase
MNLKRTNSDDPDFRSLVTQLDAYLSDVDGEEHSFFAQFNGLDKIAHTVVAYDGDVAVGCGAFKPYSDAAAEIKRMFVRSDYRGQNMGGLILAELESWAGEIGFTECILETGHRQKAAVRLYQREGYNVIPNYDQYAGVESSVCMKKLIKRDEQVAA